MRYKIIMSYIAKREDQEFAFDDLVSAEEYLLGCIIDKMQATKTFKTFRCLAAGSSIRYVPRVNSRLPEYTLFDIYASFGNEEFNTKFRTGFKAESALRHASPELRERYAKARQKLIEMLPKQNHEAEIAKRWHENYLKDYEIKDHQYPPYWDGPGPSTEKYNESDVGPNLLPEI